MSSHPAETVDLFFHLQQERIDEDLAAASGRLDAIGRDLDAFSRLPREEKTPERAAVWYHNQMLRARAVQLLPGTNEDTALYLIAWAAAQICQEAADAAPDTGRFLELSEQIKEIQEREGLGPDEYWKIGDGPEDYQAASDEHDALMAELDEVILLKVLRRYRFDAFADLYESDRMTYEVMKEAGRRLVLGPPSDDRNRDMNAIFDDELLSQYGPKALDLLQERLRSAGYEDF
jgi:hypothetical protein